MKNAWILVFGLLVAAPLYADEQPMDETEYEGEVPVEEEAPFEEAAPADDAAIETEPMDEAPAEEVAEDVEDVEEVEEVEEGEGLSIYVGLDSVNNTVDISGAPNGTGGDDFDTKMYRLRVGSRLNEGVGAELHLGVDNSDDGEAETDGYYGLFLVPTATVFEMVELAFPIGYASYETEGVKDEGMAYGMNIELPLRAFMSEFPDIRLGAGYMVYYQNDPARVYGANMGLRWDFNSGVNPFSGAGSWFSGVGSWIGGLWPFGDDEEEEAPAEEETVE